jgi:hemerythrin-like domain-containing protein
VLSFRQIGFFRAYLFNKSLKTMNSNIEELIVQAEAYENLAMSHMSTSDRVKYSREGKSLVLAINEVYKTSQDPELMEWMKRITVKKQKIEKRIKNVPTV